MLIVKFYDDCECQFRIGTKPLRRGVIIFFHNCFKLLTNVHDALYVNSAGKIITNLLLHSHKMRGLLMSSIRFELETHRGAIVFNYTKLYLFSINVSAILHYHGTLP